MTKKKNDNCTVRLIPDYVDPKEISLILKPDKELISTVMHNEEIFARTYGMGYWARGVESTGRAAGSCTNTAARLTTRSRRRAK